MYIDTWQPIGKSCNGKILVSRRKLTSAFGKSSGLASQLSNCIGDKKWKSSWLILTPEKYSWYTMTRIFWKIKSNESANSQRIPAIWVKNEFYELKESDKEILEGSDCWLYDNLMDTDQKMICKALGSLETYQSVLNCQKKRQTSQYQVITFNSCMTIIVISYWHSVQVAGFKYVTAFASI